MNMALCLHVTGYDGKDVCGVRYHFSSIDEILDYWEGLSAEIKGKIKSTKVDYEHLMREGSYHDYGSIEDLLKERELKRDLDELRMLRTELEKMKAKEKKAIANGDICPHCLQLLLNPLPYMYFQAPGYDEGGSPETILDDEETSIILRRITFG
jgi:hypothetical protein